MLTNIKSWIVTNKTELARVGAIVAGAAIAVAIGLAVANASNNEELPEVILPAEELPTTE